jgi:hypothetical protein
MKSLGGSEMIFCLWQVMIEDNTEASLSSDTHLSYSNNENNTGYNTDSRVGLEADWVWKLENMMMMWKVLNQMLNDEFFSMLQSKQMGMPKNCWQIKTRKI